MTDLPAVPEAARELQIAAADLQYAIDAAADMTIDSDSDVPVATELLLQLQGGVNAIERRRKELSLPLTRVARQINDAAKASSAPLSHAAQHLRWSLRQYEATTAEAHAKAHEELQEQTGQMVVDPGSLPAVPEKTVRTASGTVTMRKRWTWEVEDIETLIRACAESPELIEFLAVSPTYVNAAVKNGMRECPGLRIYESSDPVVRA